MNKSPAVGIDQISFYTANYYIDLSVLAERSGIDVGKYHHGIGQEKMSMPAHDEDIVTMAANAADNIVNDDNRNSIKTLLFATETGIDQSKSAGVYVHKLLDLSNDCRVVELKQACYSCTAALHMACALVARDAKQSVLVIASDVARYDLDSPAEATQGCGAVAMLITAQPRLLEVHPEVGNYTEDVMDFWRPNYRKTALVDGKFSTQMYQKATLAAWDNYQHNGGLAFEALSHFCYHLPFTRMGQKAHRSLCQHNQSHIAAEAFEQQISDTLIYSRVIGNSYSAALYISLVSLLENCHDDLTDNHIGFLSYGSGCVAEFFAATVQPDYQAYLHQQHHQQMLDNRTPLTYDEYLALWHYPDPQQGESVATTPGTTGKFTLAGIYDHKRYYLRR